MPIREATARSDARAGPQSCRQQTGHRKSVSIPPAKPPSALQPKGLVPGCNCSLHFFEPKACPTKGTNQGVPLSVVKASNGKRWWVSSHLSCSCSTPNLCHVIHPCFQHNLHARNLSHRRGALPVLHKPFTHRRKPFQDCCLKAFTHGGCRSIVPRKPSVPNCSVFVAVARQHRNQHTSV